MLMGYSHTELLRIIRAEGARKSLALTTQKPYRKMMLQQASFNGGANGNLYAIRK